MTKYFFFSTFATTAFFVHTNFFYFHTLKKITMAFKTGTKMADLTQFDIDRLKVPLTPLNRNKFSDPTATVSIKSSKDEQYVAPIFSKVDTDNVLFKFQHISQEKKTKPGPTRATGVVVQTARTNKAGKPCIAKYDETIFWCDTAKSRGIKYFEKTDHNFGVSCITSLAFSLRDSIATKFAHLHSQVLNGLAHSTEGCMFVWNEQSQDILDGPDFPAGGITSADWSDEHASKFAERLLPKLQRKYPLVTASGSAPKGMLEVYCSESNLEHQIAKFKLNITMLKSNKEVKYAKTKNGLRPVLNLTVFKSSCPKNELETKWIDDSYHTELNHEDMWEYFEDKGDRDFAVKCSVRLAYVSQKTIAFELVSVIILENSDLNRTYTQIDRGNTFDTGAQRIKMRDPDDESDDDNEYQSPTKRQRGNNDDKLVDPDEEGDDNVNAEATQALLEAQEDDE